MTFQNASFFSGTSSAVSMTQSGTITASKLYNTDYLDRKYDYNDTKESYEVAYTGRDSAIDTDISNIMYYLENGYEDKAMEAYETLLNEMTSQTRYAQLVSESGDDTQLRAVARTLIEQQIYEKTGTNTGLDEFIKDNAVSASGLSWQKTFLNNSKLDENTQEDLLNAMCNMNEEKHVTGGQYVLEAICTIVKPFTELGDFLFGGKHH